MLSLQDGAGLLPEREHRSSGSEKTDIGR